MPTEKLTQDQIEIVHDWFDDVRLREIADAGFSASADKIVVLLNAIARDRADPRPSDMAELAKLVAAELRRRGIWAEVVDGNVETLRFGTKNPKGANVTWGIHVLFCAEFDNLGPIACADEIQRQEARRAQEWAGDK